jgi:hypothetical protein
MESLRGVAMAKRVKTVNVREEVVHDASRYRRLALALPSAVESSHMGAADFRIDGRIFATLAYEKKGLGTLKISVEQQAAFLAEAPGWFTPAPGGWGRMGMTLVRLDAPEDVLAGGLATAHQHVLRAGAAKTGARMKAKTRV